MQQAERVKLFGREARAYDRSRPGYPDALIGEVLGPSPRGLSVLDVGSGTGIASRLMAAQGAAVLGVELNAGMAQVAEEHGIATEVAAFEAWDAAGRTFDRVTCAQAWYWLDQAVSARKAASLLRPGGRICLFWNIGHHPDDLADALQGAYRRVLPPGSPRLVIGYTVNRASDATPDFREATDALRDCGGFARPRLTSFPWTRTYTTDEWLDELRSHSDHAALAPELRQALFGEIGATIDGFGGRFAMAYAAFLISAALIR